MDLTSGIDLASDYVLSDAPADPDMREGANVWLVDDHGRFALPRVSVEAIGRAWGTRVVQYNVAFPDGRVLLGRGRESSDGAEGANGGATPELPVGLGSWSPAIPAVDAAGKPTVFGSEHVALRCVEPFDRWSASFRGLAVDAQLSQLLAGECPTEPTVPIGLDVELTMAAPAWVYGSLSPDAARQVRSGVEGAFVGDVAGLRFEQLCRAEGVLTIDGAEEPFTACGLRIHRRGVRNVAGFTGHCWQTAIFPSGRAVGYIAFAPRPDGQASLNDAFVIDGGRMVSARVVEAPWLSDPRSLGADVGFVVESELGTVRIAGELCATVHGSFDVGEGLLPIQQGGARYEWDGEVAYNMIERSYPIP